MPTTARPVHTLAAAAVAAAAAALAAGCTGGSPPVSEIPPASAPAVSVGHAAAVPPDPTPSPAGTRPATGPRRTEPRRGPSAADSLAGFFAAAAADDARIRATARVVSRGVGPTTVHFSRSDRDAVEAARPERTARAVPAGLDPELQRAVLVVYNDLVTRAATFVPVWELSYGPVPRTDVRVRRFLDSLRLGSSVARAFPADLAAARALAAARPAVAAVRPDSRAAAEVAVRVELIELANLGCGSSGTPVRQQLAPIRWATGAATAGSVGGIRFTARHAAARGWTVELNAC